MIGLVIAGLCALKSSYLVFAALFLLIWYALRMAGSPRTVLTRELSLIGFIAGVLLIPWMWQQYRSAGTPLYPFLGRGYYVSARNIFSPQNFVAVTAKTAKAALRLPFLGPVAPAIVALCLWAGNPSGECIARSRAFAAALAGALAITLLLGSHDQAIRYIQPFLYASLIPVGLAGFFGARVVEIDWTGALPGHVRRQPVG